MLKTMEHGPVTEWVLNRPEKRNALSLDLVAELTQAIDRVRESQACRVVILSAAGSEFCSGHDLRELRSATSKAHYERIFSSTMSVIRGFRKLPQPVIAKVRGAATAAGCQLVAAADLAVCDHTARFCTPGVNLGLFCSTPMVPLTKNLSRKHAFEMLFLGEWHSAEDALRFGLVNRVVEPQSLDSAVMDMASQIASKSKAVVGFGKNVFYQHANLEVEEGEAFATAAMCHNMTSPDAIEGIDAFLEKRPPNWRHDPIPG